MIYKNRDNFFILVHDYKLNITGSIGVIALHDKNDNDMEVYQPFLTLNLPHVIALQDSNDYLFDLYIYKNDKYEFLEKVDAYNISTSCLQYCILTKQQIETYKLMRTI